MEKARNDKNIVVLCSDSRGSASLAKFADAFPRQFVEVGIAEQNLVGIAAGLASCGKRAFVASPACFLTTRSFEQIKVDVAYSGFNVKLIGISGGVSYGTLGMTHHSTQDIAAMASLPNMRVFLPSDRHQTRRLFETIIHDDKPAYIRVGRNPVPDIYTENFTPFDGNDVTLISCGETSHIAFDAAKILKNDGINCRVIDMCCLKPFDTETVLKAARETRFIVTVEEHGIIGGLGSLVCQAVAAHHPTRVISLALPDSPVISGTSREVFDYYGLSVNDISNTIRKGLGAL
jgi:transketolase